MSRAFKAGDLVRVSLPSARSAYARSLPFGAVVELEGEQVQYGELHGPLFRIKAQGNIPAYLLPVSGLKLAKQAMRKRESYANRRG